MAPLVTIGIPTYNRADGFLRDSLESALGQTYENVEVLVADNCSTDNTEDVIKAYADRRLTYTKHKRNIGPNENFNFLADKASGIYFILLHDDDKIDPDFVATCMKAAEYRTDIGLIRTGMRRIDKEGKVIDEYRNNADGLSNSDFILAWFEGKTPMHLCSTIFNTKRLSQVGGFGTKCNVFQDVAAELEIAIKYGRLDVPDVMASFRSHTEQDTVIQKMDAWSEDSLYLLNLINELIPDENLELMRKGHNFFLNHNLKLVRKVSPFHKRIVAYLIVIRKFKTTPISTLKLVKREIRPVIHSWHRRSN